MHHISPERATAALQGLTIPPRPSILVDIYTRLQRGELESTELAARIAKDVVLSAAVLKTVNSAGYGLRAKCSSISHAVQLLGLSNVSVIVTGVLLRHSVGGQKVRFERFWDSAEKVAMAGSRIAALVPGLSRDDAYLFGLFRDVGIPMLMLRWPEYRDTLAFAARERRLLTEVEDERHGTDHAVIGHLFARSWGLPRHLCEGILSHHDPAAFDAGSGISREGLALVAVNHLAENICESVRRPREDPGWVQLFPVLLDYLGLHGQAYSELAEELHAAVAG